MPSIFPGPAYLSSKVKKKRLGRKVVPVQLKCNTEKQYNSNLNTIFEHNESSSYSDEYENCNLFNEILACEDIHRVINWPLCSPKCEETKDVSSFCFVTFHLGESIPIVEKFIKVQKSGTIIFGIFDQIVDSSILGINPATNIDEFKENINAFEKIKVCHGIPKSDEFSNVPKVICKLSPAGQLVHNNCLKIIKDKKKNCLRCSRLRNVLLMRQLRKREGCKPKILLSPSKKPVIDKLRRTCHNIQKKCIRSKQTILNLKLELGKIKKQMENYSKESIIEKCQGMNESQKTLILECFAASKTKNPKSRRYSENW